MADKTIVIERTISIELGAGALAHNRRDFVPSNVNQERTCENITYYEEDIWDVYHELFDDTVDRYNDKQKRNDRKIEDYYEKIASGKQEKTFHEIVVEIGNKDDMGSTSEFGELAKEVLDEYMKSFQDRNPTLRVFAADLHMDEATPHLHIDFIPYISGWTGKGMDTKVSLKQALAKLGFVSEGRSNTEWASWVYSEKEHLAETMERHGIRWKQLGTHREHLSVLDFKKEERAKEVAELENELDHLQESNEAQRIASEQLRRELGLVQADIIDANERKKKADEAVKNAEEEAEKANKLVEKNKMKEREIRQYITTFERNVREYNEDKKWQLPDPDLLMTASGYRDKKALPLVKKLKDVIRNLTLQLIDALSENDRLKSLLKRKENRILGQEDLIDRLNEENAYFKQRDKLLGLVERAAGAENIMAIAAKQEEREDMEHGMRKQRKNRDNLSL